jgi:hypothetical protein
VEQNCKAGQNPSRVVVPTEEEEEDRIRKNKFDWLLKSAKSKCIPRQKN